MPYKENRTDVDVKHDITTNKSKKYKTWFISHRHRQTPRPRGIFKSRENAEPKVLKQQGKQEARACKTQDLTEAQTETKMLSFNGIEVRRPVLPASRGSNRPRWRDSRHDDVLYSDEHPHQAESR